MTQTAPRGERLNIGLFGRRNAGKSSLLNALCGQEVSIVSAVAGTTTDAVSKIYELIPVGPVTFFDTAGVDDKGEVGQKRVDATMRVMKKVDIAMVITDETGVGAEEDTLIKELKELNVPFVVVFNKCDKVNITGYGFDFPTISVSAKDGANIEELKALLKSLVPESFKKRPPLVADLIKAGDTVVCIAPIDASAPKGRLILPQVQVIRDILDTGAYAYTVQNQNDYKAVEANLKTPPALVITDSQLIRAVAETVPQTVPLTTFSTLFARYKGDFDTLLHGARKLQRLTDGSRVLIAEACSHHVQDDDIARVKMPALIQKACAGKIDFNWCAGVDFPDDLGDYDLVVHCGGCMLTRQETLRRLNECVRSNVPVTNFGMALSAVQGVLDRVTAPFFGTSK